MISEEHVEAVLNDYVAARKINEDLFLKAITVTIEDFVRGSEEREYGGEIQTLIETFYQSMHENSLRMCIADQILLRISEPDFIKDRESDSYQQFKRLENSVWTNRILLNIKKQSKKKN